MSDNYSWLCVTKAVLCSLMQMQIHEQLGLLLYLHLVRHNYYKCEEHVQFNSSLKCTFIGHAHMKCVCIKHINFEIHVCIEIMPKYVVEALMVEHFRVHYKTHKPSLTLGCPRCSTQALTTIGIFI